MASTSRQMQQLGPVIKKQSLTRLSISGEFKINISGNRHFSWTRPVNQGNVYSNLSCFYQTWRLITFWREANAKVNGIRKISHPYPPKPFGQCGCPFKHIITSTGQSMCKFYLNRFSRCFCICVKNWLWIVLALYVLRPLCATAQCPTVFVCLSASSQSSMKSARHHTKKVVRWLMDSGFLMSKIFVKFGSGK